MIDAYNIHKSSVLGVQEVEKTEVSKYGIVSGSLISIRKNVYSKRSSGRTIS